MEKITQQSKMNTRLLIFPAPFQGHVTPMIHLANLLYYKGFSITVIQSTYNALNPVSYPHFTFCLLNDGLYEAYDKCSPPKAFKVLDDLNANCMEPFRDCISQIMKDASAADQERVACLIIDPVWSFPGDVANSFNLPRIALRTGGLSTYVVYESLPLLREKGYFPHNEKNLNDTLLEFPPLKLKDLPGEEHYDLITCMLRETNTARGIICNTFEDLEDAAIARLRKTLPCPVFSIGPLHKHVPASKVSIWKEDQTAIDWLNTKAPNSVLYVSFGSVAAMTEDEFNEITWGLANSEQPFLWVIRPGLIQGSENYMLPNGFKDIVSKRGHIVKWAPQQRVLSHAAVGGFWTHSGWNSTLESICEGVPMLCLPFLGDQSMNARFVSEKWKIGLQLERGMKRDEIEKAIRKLMVEEESKELRSRIAYLKEKSEVCLMEDHSSHKSLNMLTNYILEL